MRVYLSNYSELTNILPQVKEKYVRSQERENDFEYSKGYLRRLYNEIWFSGYRNAYNYSDLPIVLKKMACTIF